MEKRVIDGINFEGSGLSERDWKLLVEWHNIRLWLAQTGDQDKFNSDRKRFNEKFIKSRKRKILASHLATISRAHALK